MFASSMFMFVVNENFINEQEGRNKATCCASLWNMLVWTSQIQYMQSIEKGPNDFVKAMFELSAHAPNIVPIVSCVLPPNNSSGMKSFH